MKSSPIILICFFLAAACSPFVTKYDVYDTRASLEKDEPVHLNNSLEWWYYTGHLQAADGRKFGVEYVFFHFTTRERKSNSYMVNFAVSDPQKDEFHFDYDFFRSKETPEAGVLPLSIDKGSYALTGQNGSYSLSGNMPGDSIGVSLSTTPAKEPVFQNGTGYEEYGDVSTAGYYSFPRLDAQGFLLLNSDTVPVSGQLWYDRQWNCGTNLIGGNSSWDWISIQFAEAEEELMVYRVEDRKRGRELFGGSFHKASGAAVYLEDGAVEMTPLKYWTSEDTKRKYPISWRVKVPELYIDIQVDAAFPHQELVLKRLGFKLPYWEGMCDVKGTISGESRTGDAYLEMTNREKVK